MDQLLVGEVSVCYNKNLDFMQYIKYTVQCAELINPANGIISCSLINSSSFSYEDTCSFTCNTGYELTGSDTRTCQSDGSWNGSDVSCNRGKYTASLQML